MSAPVVLITGATSGIGYEVARQLLSGGSTVIVHGPTRQSTDKAVTRLVNGGGDPLKIDTAVADFAHLGEVTSMAQDIAGRYRRLDVLVNNAAIAGPPGRRESSDGNELTFQVNYLSGYLLTRLLTSRLVTGNGRVINVSSILHRTANLNWADPHRVKNYSPVAAYAQSKLALTMFASTLAAKEPGLTAVSVHPGIIETGLVAIYTRAGGHYPAEGARAITQLCSGEVHNGSYYDQFRIAAHTPLADNAKALDRLWKLSAAAVGLGRQVNTLVEARQ